MRSSAIEQASSTILTYGSPRQRELRAYLLARGRFADVLALAAIVAPVRGRILAIAA